MTIVLSNPDITDDERRTRLYSGQVLVYPASPGSLALVEHARSIIAEAFGTKDPQTAQHDMPVEDFAALLSELKPKFIHHPESKVLIKALLASLRCDLDRTYFDVPRMRTSTSDDYLTSGISYAFHPHRDTWYSAPFSQLNWWIPIYSVVPENVMAFHPQYWSNPLRNGSRGATTTTSGTAPAGSPRHSTSRPTCVISRNRRNRYSWSHRSASCPRWAAS